MSTSFIGLARNRVSVVWAMLVAATCLSWWMGNDASGSAREIRIISTALLVIAFVKVRFVISFFMEVREAGFFLRAIVDAWVFLVCAGLIGLYWFT